MAAQVAPTTLCHAALGMVFMKDNRVAIRLYEYVCVCVWASWRVCGGMGCSKSTTRKSIVSLEWPSSKIKKRDKKTKHETWLCSSSLEAESDTGFRGTGSTEGVSSGERGGGGSGWGMGSGTSGKVLQPNPLGALEYDLCHRTGPTIIQRGKLLRPHGSPLSAAERGAGISYPVPDGSCLAEGHLSREGSTIRQRQQTLRAAGRC